MLDRTSVDETATSGGALREALRRARSEAAQQADVVIDLRNAEIARLALLQEELSPIFAQVPADVDIFDLGLASGDRPRLFVDMVSFVEMDRDRRVYRFLRDGRHGRGVVAESDRTGPIVEAVTDYVARRLVERERLLTDEDRLSSQDLAAPSAVRGQSPEPAALAGPSPAVPAEPVGRNKGLSRLLKLGFAFLVGAAIGGVVVVALIYAVMKGLIPL